MGRRTIFVLSMTQGRTRRPVHDADLAAVCVNRGLESRCGLAACKTPASDSRGWRPSPAGWVGPGLKLARGNRGAGNRASADSASARRENLALRRSALRVRGERRGKGYPHAAPTASRSFAHRRHVRGGRLRRRRRRRSLRRRVRHLSTNRISSTKAISSETPTSKSPRRRRGRPARR